MKLFILLAAVAVCNAAKLDKTYLPPHARTSGGSDGFLQTPVLGQNPFGPNAFAHSGNGFGPVVGAGPGAFARAGPAPGAAPAYSAALEAARPRAALERSAAILRQDNSNDGERYSYAYETENGIYAEENGVATNGVMAQGGFSYTGDDGQVYSIRYTADENGFVPQGDHLPTPPPVPAEILRALEQNARDEAAGIYDDGSYSAAQYGGADARGSGGYASPGADSLAVDAAPRAPARRPAPALTQAYLPPTAGQRLAGRQSYDPRTGYRY